MALAGWFKWLFRKPHSFTPATAAGRMAPAIIREFKPDDFDACCDIYLTNERDHFPDRHFQEFKTGLTTNAALWLVIEAENEVIGVGGICLEHKEGGLCHLLFGMICPDRRRQGYGSALLLARLAALPEPVELIFMSMAPVVNSIKYYEQFGFEFSGSERSAKSNNKKLQISCSVLTTPAWRECSSLLSAARIEFNPDQCSVPVRSTAT